MKCISKQMFVYNLLKMRWGLSDDELSYVW